MSARSVELKAAQAIGQERQDSDSGSEVANTNHSRARAASPQLPQVTENPEADRQEPDVPPVVPVGEDRDVLPPVAASVPCIHVPVSALCVGETTERSAEELHSKCATTDLSEPPALAPVIDVPSVPTRIETLKDETQATVSPGMNGVGDLGGRPGTSSDQFDGRASAPVSSDHKGVATACTGEVAADEPGDGNERGERAQAPRERRVRPSLESYEQAFVDPSLRDLAAAYVQWNKALASCCLLGTSEDVTYLSVTPRILASAFHEVGGGVLTPEEAERHFADSVSAMYHARVLPHSAKLGTLRRCGPDGLPECIAFLAASVLAAYRMHSDEGIGANAYYKRLGAVLRCTDSNGRLAGFDADAFEGLWVYLRTWLEREHGKRLAMPAADVGLRRYVALPLTHVPLRQVDIERLSDFFGWAGYEPGTRVAREVLERDLVAWASARSLLTNAGLSALSDERRPAVVAQVVHELESWDGEVFDSFGRRSARVEVLLDIVQRRPELSYLARRPAGFPSEFDDGEHAFAAEEEGWYEPVRIESADGDQLASGFEWEMRSGDIRLVLRRTGTSVIALPASSEYTGFLSANGMHLGAVCAALCRADLAAQAAKYLSEVAEQPCKAIQHTSVPAGWCLFAGVKPRRIVTPPTGLERLAVQRVVDVIPSGGLRLGSRWAWLAGAPPLLTVVGLGPTDSVTLDGLAQSVGVQGDLQVDGLLDLPGVHIVRAAGVTRRLEIVRPLMHPLARERVENRTIVGLPGGAWTLLGAVPGEIEASMGYSRRAALLSATFTPIWAVEVGPGPGARVVCLVSTSPPRPQVMEGPSPANSHPMRWASKVYDAAVRRPQFLLPSGEDCSPEVKAEWAHYVRVAREIKRRARWARR